MLDDETKKLIEKLLLRGERMLGETCPVCGTPLFLIKEVGLKFCPKCKRYVVSSEEEYKKALSMGIPKESMIIVGFNPEDSRPKERVEKNIEGIKRDRSVEERLKEIILELVETGRYDDARKVADILEKICSCK